MTFNTTDEYIQQREIEIAEAKAEYTQGANLGSWWTWTQAEFTTWCDNNLMTDAAIDATTLSASLKNNLKANNAFTRNAGKLLIVARNLVKWLLKNIISA